MGRRGRTASEASVKRHGEMGRRCATRHAQVQRPTQPTALGSSPTSSPHPLLYPNMLANIHTNVNCTACTSHPVSCPGPANVVATLPSHSNACIPRHSCDSCHVSAAYHFTSTLHMTCEQCTANIGEEPSRSRPYLHLLHFQDLHRAASRPVPSVYGAPVKPSPVHWICWL